MAVQYCDETYPNFCESQKSSIDSACHDLNKSAGKWIMYTPFPPGPQCYCICSCMAAGTPVATEDGEIEVEKIAKGSTEVLAAGLSLQFQPTVVQNVSRAAPGPTDNTVKLRYRVHGEERLLVVTMDHPFIVRNRVGEMSVVGAGALQLDDELVDKQGGPAQVLKLEWGRYDGGFWEFATTMNQPDAQLTGHLVLTGGVVTGDFAVSTFVTFPSELGSMTCAPDRPTVGSPDWYTRNGESPGDEPEEVNGAWFRPAAAHRIEVPAHASSFLPAYQSGLLESPTVPKQPATNQYLLEECEWLINKVFRPLYPKVTYLFNWYSDEPNAHSWTDLRDSEKKYVYLSGGLARIDGFEYEGMAFALAHEIGHLYGKPKGPNNVTCEGKADWYAGSLVMRNLWFGGYYFEYTGRAHEQLKRLYAYMAGRPEAKPQGGGDYPSDACRLDTIEAAMRSPNCPGCAQCPPERT